MNGWPISDPYFKPWYEVLISGFIVCHNYGVYTWHAYVGAEGKVDESLAVLAEVETLKTKKKEAEVTVLLYKHTNKAKWQAGIKFLWLVSKAVGLSIKQQISYFPSYRICRNFSGVLIFIEFMENTV